MISVRELQKKYPDALEPTLKGISFDVREGSVAAILGRSGAGKSTLLRCLVGLEPFDSGTISVDGAQLHGRAGGESSRAQRTAVSAVRSALGLVFQSFELFPHLTVLENCVLAPTRVKREPLDEVTQRSMALLEQLGLAERAGAYPDLLSGGQRQRVAIARALAMRPKVLLYDEPTSALDPSLRLEVAQTVRRISETKVTQLIVTHDLGLARSACDCVFVLDHGRMVESGAPAQVLVSPEHEATRRLIAAD